MNERNYSKISMSEWSLPFWIIIVGGLFILLAPGQLFWLCLTVYAFYYFDNQLENKMYAAELRDR